MGVAYHSLALCEMGRGGGGGPWPASAEMIILQGTCGSYHRKANNPEDHRESILNPNVYIVYGQNKATQISLPLRDVRGVILAHGRLIHLAFQYLASTWALIIARSFLFPIWYIALAQCNGDLDEGGGGGLVTWSSGINLLWDFYIVSSSSQSFDLRFSTFSN